MNKYVLDTDVVVAAMRSPSGASAALLSAALDGRVTLQASVPLFVEYEAKCSMRKHQAVAGLTEKDSWVFLNGLAALVEPVKTHFLWRPTLRDPNDEMVLEVAVNGGCDALVSFNLRDFGEVPSQFGIDLILPSEALGRLNLGA